MAFVIDFHHGAVVIRDDWIGGIDYAGRIGIGNVELVGAGSKTRAAW